MSLNENFWLHSCRDHLLLEQAYFLSTAATYGLCSFLQMKARPFGTMVKRQHKTMT